MTKKRCDKKEQSTENIWELMSFNFKPGGLTSLNLTHEEIETPKNSYPWTGKNLNNVKLTFKCTEGNYSVYPFDTWVY